MAVVKLNLSGHENAKLAEQGFLFPGALHVDLADPELPNKVNDFLSPLVSSGDTVILALPGLAYLSAIVIATIHGLSGHFPQIQALVRTDEGFVPNPLGPLGLQDFRNDVARASRAGVVKL